MCYQGVRCLDCITGHYYAQLIHAKITHELSNVGYGWLSKERFGKLDDECAAIPQFRLKSIVPGACGSALHFNNTNIGDNIQRVTTIAMDHHRRPTHLQLARRGVLHQILT